MLPVQRERLDATAALAILIVMGFGFGSALGAVAPHSVPSAFTLQRTTAPPTAPAFQRAGGARVAPATVTQPLACNLPCEPAGGLTEFYFEVVGVPQFYNTYPVEVDLMFYSLTTGAVSNPYLHWQPGPVPVLPANQVQSGPEFPVDNGVEFVASWNTNYCSGIVGSSGCPPTNYSVANPDPLYGIHNFNVLDLAAPYYIDAGGAQHYVPGCSGGGYGDAYGFGGTTGSTTAVTETITFASCKGGTPANDPLTSGGGTVSWPDLGSGPWPYCPASNGSCLAGTVTVQGQRAAAGSADPTGGSTESLSSRDDTVLLIWGNATAGPFLELGNGTYSWAAAFSGYTTYPGNGTFSLYSGENLTIQTTFTTAFLIKIHVTGMCGPGSFGSPYGPTYPNLCQETVDHQGNHQDGWNILKDSSVCVAPSGAGAPQCKYVASTLEYPLGRTAHHPDDLAFAFWVANGTYNWTVGPLPGYRPTTGPSSGSLTVVGTNVTVNVSFAPVLYPVTFTEVGLPAGTAWTAALGNLVVNTTSSSIVLQAPNGTYRYLAAAANSYGAVNMQPSGNITVNATNRSVTVYFASEKTFFVAFRERGLTPGSEWCVQLVFTQCSNGSKMTFSDLTPWSYAFSVPAVTGYRIEGCNLADPNDMCNILDGVALGQASDPNVHVRVSFTPRTYPILLNATGFPLGSLLHFKAVCTTPRTAHDPQSCDGSMGRVKVRFHWARQVEKVYLRNGTYDWAVKPISGYVLEANGVVGWNGTLTVSGTGVTFDFLLVAITTQFSRATFLIGGWAHQLG